jgi:hypothetical protein
MAYTSVTNKGLGSWSWMGHTLTSMDYIYSSKYQNTSDQKMRLGTKVCTHDGREFAYVQFVETGQACAEGTVLVPSPQTTLGTLTVTNITSADNTAQFPYVTLSGAAWTEGKYAGWWCEATGGTAGNLTWVRRVVWNTADTLYFERAWPAAPAANDDYSVFNPYVVARCDGSSQLIAPSGVGIGAITDDYFGWMQTKGLCEAVLVDAVTTASNLLVPSNAAAGNAEIYATGGVTTIFATAVTAGGTSTPCMAQLWGCAA